ncbi:hypothetical protein JCM10213v2_001191 [Rhodosporidiobolus nylandii]
MSSVGRQTPAVFRQTRLAYPRTPALRSLSTSSSTSAASLVGLSSPSTASCAALRTSNSSRTPAFRSREHSSSTRLAPISHARSGPILSTRTLSTSTLTGAENPSSLLVEHTVPANESESVSRIERLMELGDRLAASAGPDSTPARMKPTGVFSRENAGSKLVQVQEGELEPLPKTRRMGDSYVQLDLRFSQDEQLREAYVGGLSKVRVGRLMEDFDGVAGAAAYRHVLPEGAEVDDATKHGFYLVTAAVDRMDMLRPLLNPDGSVPDLRLSAHVSFTSTSSLEVFCRLSTLPSSPFEEASTILIGRFAMAARAFKGGKFNIPQLEVVGPEEEEMWKLGKEMREGKVARSSKSLEKTPPTAEEAALLHELFIQRAAVYDRQAPTPPNVIFMSDTRIKERNQHGKIFGGYLMRMAYETAYATSCLFARSPVTFVALDELVFRQPVEIGSLLMLDSRVTFSPMEGEHHSFHVSVEAATVDLQTGEKKVTNTFCFTFTADKPLERHVLPRSYKQAMAWLDAQRRRRVGIEIRKVYEH